MLTVLIFSLVSLSYSSVSSDEIRYPGSISPLTLDCISNDSQLSGAPCEVNASGNTHLSISFTVNHVRNNFGRFRAHPLLVSCLQDLSSSLSIQLHILQFYLAEGEELVALTNDTHLNEQLKYYHMAGLAVSFNIPNGSIDNFLTRLILLCWNGISNTQYSVGIVNLNQSRLDLLLTNQTLFYPNDIGDSFYALLNSYLIPSSWPKCFNGTFAEHSSYPDNITMPELVVGAITSYITRNSLEFLSLKQYPATNIIFSGCDSSITGASAHARCSSRVMSFRMYRMLQVLSALVGTFKSTTLKVVRSWSNDPLNVSQSICFSFLNTALYSEGRAMLLEAVGNLSQSHLAGLARCSGFDFVYYGCGYVLVAVRDQRSTSPLTVVFPKSILLPVNIREPASHYNNNTTPLAVSHSPLFDSSGIRDTKLSEGFKVCQIAGSKRYFRIHPVLVGCLQLLEEYLNCYFKNDSRTFNYTYLREQISAGDRWNLKTGLAVEINFTYQDYSPLDLTVQIISSCASYISLQPTPFRRMQFGLYSNSLFFKLAAIFSVWNDSSMSVPTSTLFSIWLEKRYIAALKGYLVKPTSFRTACNFSILPCSSPYTYSSHYDCEVIQPYLERTDPGNCMIQTGTSFCKESLYVTVEIYSRILAVMRRKYWRKEIQLEESIIKCFNGCSICPEGEVWRTKLENCDNLVHWAPFELIHQPNNINFYVIDNKNVEKFACDNDRVCVNKSPLYAILAPIIEYSFRPNVKKPYERYLYSIADNPLPTLFLLNRVFAISGVGNATIWVTNDDELLVMDDILRTLMLCNRNIDYVNIQIFRANQYSIVHNQMEANIKDWSNHNCLTVSRDIIAPYRISIVQNLILTKREEHSI